MKRFCLLILSVLSIISFGSCGVNVLRGEGKKTTKTPSVKAFDAVDSRISSKVRITVTEGAANSLELRGFENIIKHIKTEVRQNTLYLSFDLDDTWTVNSDDMEIQITTPSLKMLSMSGFSDAEVHGNITGSVFKVDMSGAGSLTIDEINVEKFAADLSGAADLKIKGGNAKLASYELSGVGNVSAYPLQTEETMASLSGAADGEVSASRLLDARISGTGSITYKGKPEVKEHVSGMGSVSAAD
jgi:hypothetical protein